MGLQTSPDPINDELMTNSKSAPLRSIAARLSPRRWVQLGFLLFTLWLGWEFSLFIGQFETPPLEQTTSARWVAHPDGVEAFLPIGGLTSLKHWITSGTVHPLHPAALFIFIAVLGVSTILKKSFCGWICPVGFLSELAYKPWKSWFKKNVQLPKPIDFTLRSLKYLVLGFFFWIIVIAMTPAQGLDFLDSDYWKIADVKMYYFFASPSTLSLIVIGSLVLLSIPMRNFWCRFLCPYGALLGLTGLLSPFKIRRDVSLCHNCKKCTRNCPAHLPVATSKSIISPECTSCLTCKTGCPSGALTYSSGKKSKGLSPRILACAVVLGFVAVILAAKLGGVWKSQVSTDDLHRLIPGIGKMEHPQ